MNNVNSNVLDPYGIDWSRIIQTYVLNERSGYTSWKELTGGDEVILVFEGNGYWEPETISKRELILAHWEELQHDVQAELLFSYAFGEHDATADEIISYAERVAATAA